VDDLMGRKVNLEAPKETGRADVIVCLVDISRPKSDEENKVIGVVRKSIAKKVLVYNKIDKAIDTKDHLSDYNYLEEEFDKVIKVSALKDKYVKSLVNIIFELLPETKKEEIEEDTEIMSFKKGPKIGMGSQEYIEEIIREKAYLFLRREVPYTIKVVVNQITDKKKILVVEATIFTTADRYKKIIIGEGGRKIKEIGYNARKELELMSGRKIFLELTVKTDTHWMEESAKN
jgi:GTP-binding protein Era